MPGHIPIIGGPLPRMDHRCGYASDPNDLGTRCPAPAVVHLLILPVGFDLFVLACEEHHAFVDKHYPVGDRHAVGASCDFPGAVWMPSDTGKQWDSRCVWVEGEQIAAELSEELEAVR